MTRLDKLVADRSDLSRKQARAMILRGQVRLEAEGAPVRDPATKVDPARTVFLGRTALQAPPELAVLHKPLGVVSTVSDPHGRPCLAEVAEDLLAMGLHPVGRLDRDTDGLLPFSRHGAWTQHLLHPRHRVAKRYRARIEGVATQTLVDRLAEGVTTSEGTHTAVVHHLDGDELELSVTEGKHRMVRRMLANAGHPVVALRRLAFGPMQLGDLGAGDWRPATAPELAWLRERLSTG